jgi:glycosyltransferase involved in cell wall biosynthesis
MRILFLLSCLEPSGSETYCLSLAKTWEGRHDVHWISDQLHYDQVYRSMPISGKAIPWGIFNTLRVAWYIKRQKIQVIHSHSRRANWVAAQSAALTGIPHVTTVHQPFPAHFFSKNFPCAGDMAIAIDERVSESLVRTFNIPASQVTLIRNGIALTEHASSLREIPGLKKILIVGRLSGGRWRPLQFFLETLEKAGHRLPPALYQIVGQVPQQRQSDLTRQLSILNSKLAPGRVEVMGFVKDLAVAIRNADAIVGAGRSALEGLANTRPTILLGEGGVMGLCKPANWTSAMKSNFADHMDPPVYDGALLEASLREVLIAPGPMMDLVRWGRSQVEQYYDVNRIARQIEAVYERLGAGRQGK